VKQWQKLIQLGLEYVFHAVTMSEETESEALTQETLSRSLEKLKVKLTRTAFVGCSLSHEIAVANRFKMITIRI
jgi:FMN phosphatase YigB (HAD superfamily)